MRVKSVPPLAGILCIGLLFSWAAAAAAEDGEDEMNDMMEDYFEYYMRESTRSGNPCSKLNYQCIFPNSYFFLKNCGSSIGKDSVFRTFALSQLL